MDMTPVADGTLTPDEVERPQPPHDFETVDVDPEAREQSRGAARARAREPRADDHPEHAGDARPEDQQPPDQLPVGLPEGWRRVRISFKDIGNYGFSPDCVCQADKDTVPVQTGRNCFFSSGLAQVN